MKKSLLVSAIALAAALPGTVLASSVGNSATLEVTASITVASCSISLDDEGAAVLPSVGVETLSKTNMNSLGEKDIGLKVTCQADTPFALQASDAYAGAVPSGLGAFIGNGAADTDVFAFDAKGGDNIGGYTIELTDAKLDDASTSMFEGATTTGSWAAAKRLRPGSHYVSFGVDGNGVKAAKKADVNLKVKGAMVGTDGLNLATTTTLSGRTTITLVTL